MPIVALSWALDRVSIGFFGAFWPAEIAGRFVLGWNLLGDASREIFSIHGSKAAAERPRWKEEPLMPHGPAVVEDPDQLLRLNTEYIDCARSSDVRGFEKILADDFLCSQPDGSLVDRQTFLSQVGRSSPFDELRAEDVKVRILGDVAIIHAATVYALSGKEPRRGRYTDVWARRNGRWLAVSAHVTR